MTLCQVCKIIFLHSVLLSLSVAFEFSEICAAGVHDHSRVEKLDPMSMVLKLISDHDCGAWVQIGANTMDQELATNNPLMNALGSVPHWNKYFLEPIPHNYERLVENVKKWPNVTTIQAALNGDSGSSEEIGELYCLEGYHLPTHAHHHNKNIGVSHSADELCSFDKKHILKHFPTGVVVDVSVSVMSVSVFLRMYSIEDIRMLVLDTEGWDAALLAVWPFHLSRPPVIVFEHLHLLQKDRKQAEAILAKYCYVLHNDEINTYAMQHNFAESLKK